MLKEIRRSRYGYLLSLHILLLCAIGHSPTEISHFLFCSRSSVYRAIRAYKKGELKFEEDGTPKAPVRSTCLMPTIKRSILSLLKKSPHAFGWCRSRWSCATLALELKARRGIHVSAETMRRWLHEMDWVWKRAKHAAKDDDPERVPKLARILHIFENLKPKEVMVFIDELDIHLLSKLGYEWMPKGEQKEVMTPGKNEKHYLAGALDILTGSIHYCLSASKNSALFLDLLRKLDFAYPEKRFTRVYVVADNYRIHKAKKVLEWLSKHPRFELIFLPTYCPRANPIERAFGDVHDQCTRNHKRTRIQDLVKDVENHLKFNGPWNYQLSKEIYYDEEVTTELQKMAA